MPNDFLRVASPDDLNSKDADEVRAFQNTQDAGEEDYSQLVAHIRKEFRNAKDARQKSGLSQRMIDALRTYKGDYTPEKIQDIKQFGGSEVFSRVTASKCRAATAILRDLFLSASDNPWELKPTPVPSVGEDTTAELAELLTMEVTMLAQQGQPITQKMIDERMTFLLDEATQTLNDILVEGGYYKALREFIIDLPIFPIAAIKGPIVKNEARTRWVDGQATTVYEPKMTWERVSPMDLYFTADAGDIKQSSVIEHVKFSMQDMAALVGVPGFRDDAIRKSLGDWETARQSQEWRDWFETERENLEDRDFWTTRGKLVDAVEYHGVVKAEMLAEYGLVEEQDEYDPTDMYMVDAWVVDNNLLKVQLNPALTMAPPYYVTSFEKIPGSIYGYGLVDILSDIQSVCNAAMRNLVNNMSMASGPQVIVNDDRLAPNESGNDLYPWKRWHIADHPDGNKSMPPISFFQPNSNAQELLAIYEKFSTMADEASALPRYMTGGSSGGAGRTASGLAMLMDNASKVMQNVAANIDDDILETSITRLYEVVMLTQTAQDVIRGDETIRVRGVTVAVQRETDRMRKLEFLQMTGNELDMQIIGAEGRAEVLREIANDLGMDGAKIVPSALELKGQKAQQEQAQQQAQAMAAQMQQPAMAKPQQGGVPSPQKTRDPAMAAREPQENVTRSIVQ